VRRRLLALSLGLSALGVGPAAAALSPFYESAREIAAILADPRLAAALPGQSAIVSITESGASGFDFSNGRCTVTVRVVTVPPEAGKPMVAGPRQFTLEFGKPVCR
jgi:hypothetical protein